MAISISDAKVDLILERDGTLFLIEIKCKSKPNKAAASSIRKFCQTYPNENYAWAYHPCRERNIPNRSKNISPFLESALNLAKKNRIFRFSLLIKYFKTNNCQSNQEATRDFL